MAVATECERAIDKRKEKKTNHHSFVLIMYDISVTAQRS